ncbi:hypothetical protein predicted by Glimmer/Critica [Acetobacter ghanensis]|uniref:Uncharacterized protein n=1 Tax=Acetobacter ghanensis TaxID=431306 RepID=A0A0U5F2M5_9PROT|nr:hypothetical protein predicted by Glimmer/Critica [Acetobacter ghanensis]
MLEGAPHGHPPASLRVQPMLAPARNHGMGCPLPPQKNINGSGYFLV